MARERILVFDDSPTLLQIVQLVLSKADYDVLSAEGRDATTAFVEEAPDLVLFGSWQWPEEAEAFFAALRASHAPVPVIALAPPTDPEFRRSRPEIVDVLDKPFPPEALLAVVEHALAHRRDPAAPRPANDLGSLSLVPVPGETTTTPESTALDIAATPAALSGDLAVISLADVFGLLDAEAQTGTLLVRRAAARLLMHFSGGRIELATAEGVPEEFLLGRFLVRGGALAAPSLAMALGERARVNGNGARPLLGTYLVDRGLISETALRRVLSLQSAALVFESLRWGEGRFEFHPATELPESARDAALALGVPALLLEGFRRVDEWRLIEREVGDFDGVFLRDEDRLHGFGKSRLTREETSVLELCDGRRSVREIIERSQLGAFDTTKMIYRLSRTRLIRKRVPPVAMPA